MWFVLNLQLEDLFALLIKENASKCSFPSKNCLKASISASTCILIEKFLIDMDTYASTVKEKQAWVADTEMSYLKSLAANSFCDGWLSHFKLTDA